ncbi:MAG: FG-GAP repeat protein [Cellvibrionaceae bacterium]
MTRKWIFPLGLIIILNACGGSGSTNTNDTDGDGIVNTQDAFPNKSSETLDTDNDGLSDNEDALPLKALSISDINFSVGLDSSITAQWAIQNTQEDLSISIVEVSTGLDKLVSSHNHAETSSNFDRNPLELMSGQYQMLITRPDGSEVLRSPSTRSLDLTGDQLKSYISSIKATTDNEIDDISTVDRFGVSLSISNDGSVLAITAPEESSVYVYTRKESSWKRYIIKDESFDYFGWHLTLSADGSTLIVGAANSEFIEHQEETGYTCNDYGDCVPTGYRTVTLEDHNFSLAAFKFDGLDWVKVSQAFMGQSGPNPKEISLSADASTIAVSFVRNENIRIFEFDGANLIEQPFVHNGNEQFIYNQKILGDEFVGGISLSANGKKLAVGLPNANIDCANRQWYSYFNVGLVLVLDFNGVEWIESACLQPNEYSKYKEYGSYSLAFNPSFGSSVSLSADGQTLAVGAITEGGSGSGAVYTFNLNDTIWSQAASIKLYLEGDKYDFCANNDCDSIDPLDPASRLTEEFGQQVSLSADGKVLAVSTVRDGSTSNTINGHGLTINDYPLYSYPTHNSGAAFIFKLDGNSWIEKAFLKSPNSREYGGFGNSIALSGDGSTLAVGATPVDHSGHVLDSRELNLRLLRGEDFSMDDYSGTVYIY